jgi:hypothetical protein
MPTLRGRDEVKRLQDALDATLQRIAAIPPEALEVRSDFARYLCILVAGFAEESLRELATQRCRVQSSETVASYAVSRIRGLRNVDKEKLLQFVAAFSPAWRADLESNQEAELDALSSVVNNRHVLAHGGTVGVTYATVQGYWESVKVLARRLTDMFDPA